MSLRYGEEWGIVWDLGRERRVDRLLAPCPCSASSWCKGEGEGLILLSSPSTLSAARSMAGWTTAAPRSQPPDRLGRATLGAPARERQGQMAPGKGAGTGASSRAAR